MQNVEALAVEVQTCSKVCERCHYIVKFGRLAVTLREQMTKSRKKISWECWPCLIISQANAHCQERGAKIEECSHEQCTNNVVKGGVCKYESLFTVLSHALVNTKCNKIKKGKSTRE